MEVAAEAGTGAGSAAGAAVAAPSSAGPASAEGSLRGVAVDTNDLMDIEHRCNSLGLIRSKSS